MKVFIFPPFQHLCQFVRCEVWVAFVVAENTGSSLPHSLIVMVSRECRLDRIQTPHEY